MNVERAQRVGLRLFLGLVAANAVLAAAVLLGGDVDGNAGRVLGTTATLTLGVLLALGAATASGVRRLGRAWLVGAIAAMVGALTLVAGIWAEPAGDGVWFTAFSCDIVAAGIALAGLLGRVVLDDDRRWLTTTAFVLIGILVAMSLWAIWFDGDGGVFWRIFGVGSVALTAAAIVIPVLGAVRRRQAPQAGASLAGYCPVCGRPASEPALQITCARCGATSRIEVLDPPT